jgi:P-type Ca2+ transporter type 2C
MLIRHVGTLTKNDQTITESYSVDETIYLDSSSNAPYTSSISLALRKAVDIGVLCNNASLTRNEEGVFVGQATDVAFLNALERFGLPDRRPVSPFLPIHRSTKTNT